MASLLLTSIESAKDFRYCDNENHQVKITRAKVTLEPVVGGKLITFTLSALTDQVMLGGETVVIALLFHGVLFHFEEYNLSDGVSCPVSVGDFVLIFSQVLPVDVAPGSYSFMMKLISQDGRQLSSIAFDFTIPLPARRKRLLISLSTTRVTVKILKR